MLTFKELSISGYEKVIFAQDLTVGLKCYIAIHSTKRGPSLGGVRIYPYADEESALTDALRLAKGMTYKTALAQIGIGGGKSVIIADPRTQKTPALLRAFGKVVDSLRGAYIAAEDVGSTPQDMLIIREETPYVAALPTATSSGDPSPFTAWGVLKGIEAIAKTLWKSPELKGKTIAIQGLGSVGAKIADLLFWREVNLILTDIDAEKTARLCHLYGARSIEPKDFCSTPCDILCPCALGAVFHSKNIHALQCAAIAGSANNQLAETDDAVLLHQRTILYAPDYVVNAGGIINAAAEFTPTGYHPQLALEKTNLIFSTLEQIFQQALEQNLPTNVIANRIAESHL